MKNSNNPINIGVPFVGETENMKNYKNFKVIPQAKSENKNTVEQTPSYSGQYNSTHINDFTKNSD